MKILSVFDSEFKPYGQVHSGYETTQVLAAMTAIPLPETGVAYQPALPELEAIPVFADLCDRAYGGLPIQLGMCWGRNTKLNCLEYHRDSEFNLGTHDFILLLAKQDGIEAGKLDTAKVTAFKVPAGLVVEIYATTLHYAPCHTEEEDGFRVLVALPRGTNTEKPERTPVEPEDGLLRARNKWLLAHPDSEEAAQGAYIGLSGDNIDLAAQ